MDMESGDETPNSYRRIQLWSQEETGLLLDLYGKYLSEIGPKLKFKKKREMWAQISTEIPGKTPKQCEERYKTVLRRKKTSVDKYKLLTLKKRLKMYKHNVPNKKEILEESFNQEQQMSGQLTIKEEYPEETDGVAAAEIAPTEVAADNSAKNKTIQEVLLEIAARKEEGRERRHMEKLHALNRIEIMLEKIIENQYK